MKANTNCDNCSNYTYDEECGYYTCQAKLDEDEMGRFLMNSFDNCPYFQLDDEYKTVRKQI